MAGLEASPGRAMAGNLAPLGLLGPLDIKSSHTCTSFVSHRAVLTKEAALFCSSDDSW